MRSTLRAARIRQAQVYRRLLRQVLRGIKPPAAFGGRLFIREALDLGLPEVAWGCLRQPSVPESKTAVDRLTAGGWSRDQGEEDVNSHQRALSRRRSFSSRFRTNGLA